MKNIAVVTGASSGMGKMFALTLPSHIEVDEIWAIARDKKNLLDLQNNLNIPVKAMSLDLSKTEDISKYTRSLKREKPNIKILINAAGFGKFEKTTNISNEDNIGMIKLNIEGLTKMCLESIPYMKKGAKIVNFSSVAAFQPVPYINIYAATKAYVLSFSRSLNRELKSDGISVMAVCPFWTKTQFFKRAVTKNTIVKKYVAMYESQDIIDRAWEDLKKNKDVSKYGFIARSQVLLCKLAPHSLIMSIWQKQQKLK